MSTPDVYRLNAISLVDLVGKDAVTIANNLTTNDLSSLAADRGCETFVTDLRGKTIGHFVCFRTHEGLRLLGPHGQSERFAAHADRYTIREDSQAAVRDEDVAAFVLPPESTSSLSVSFFGEAEPHRYRSGRCDLNGVLGVYEVPWLGPGTQLLLVGREDVDDVSQRLGASGLAVAQEPAFHACRTLAGFPWHGIDLDVSNLPQEADRDEEALCLTKGCYLGQETVARLDALGQVQKKLVRWSIRGCVPAAGSTLERDGKTVGRLTSVANLVGDESAAAVAIGLARRSHFDSGSAAEGTDADSGERFSGTVI